jgi:hypothetical protein
MKRGDNLRCYERAKYGGCIYEYYQFALSEHGVLTNDKGGLYYSLAVRNPVERSRNIGGDHEYR